MKRREFLALSGTAALAPLAMPVQSLAADENERDYYELRQFILETDTQKKGFDTFMKEAAIPAINRLGVKPVGVFYPKEIKGAGTTAHVLMRHKTMESFTTLLQKLGSDSDFLNSGHDFIFATAAAPAFKRMESSLLHAFKGMPTVETPAKQAGRIFQLRMYESPSFAAGQKKIEMFNDAGEIKIFREVGLNPVFFGETLIGIKMPNLTYMLGFESEEEMKAAWSKFGAHPDWKRLKGMPEYADKEILCGITNTVVVPAEYSQI